MHQTSPVTSIGIDVSKRELVAAGLTRLGTLRPRTFPNTAVGATALVSYLKTQKTAAAVPCVIESTGDFHLLSSLILAEEGFAVKCINPLLTKKYQRSSVRNAKSDTVDALRLADIGLMERNLPVFAPERPLIIRKKLITSIAHLERVSQMLTRHLASTEETMVQLGVSADLSNAHAAHKLIKRQITELNTRLMDERSERAQALSHRFPGLTDRKIAVVDAFLSGRTFAHRDELVAFAGLDVMSRRSGAWRGKERLSKRGNPYLRKTLYHIAWGLSRYEPTYRAYYQQLRVRGKHYTTSLIAVARKFLRFLYAWYFGSLRSLATVPA